MKFISIIFVLTFLYLALSCAKQSMPDGGPRDTIPPVLNALVSPTTKTNYDGKPIILEFTEDVIINNAREQLIISPSVGKEIEMVARKNKVTLTLNSNLEPNTTYTFNFRESIQDITEKNTVPNFQLALSTGSFLDSLSIKGSVYNLQTRKEIKEPTIAIYSADTFDIFKHKPSYLTKADKMGKFVIQNLKPGSYFIYSFIDKNKNLVVDSKSEMYGFIKDSIIVTADLMDSIKIPMIQLDAREFKIASARPSNTYYNIKMAKGIKDYSIKPTNPNDSSRLSHIPSNDYLNIKIFSPTLLEDSIQINFQATDSINQQIDTILFVKKAIRTVTPESFAVNLKSSTIIESNEQIQSIINYNKPIAQINYDSIYYQLDSLNTIHFSDSSFSWNIKESEITISTHIPKSLLSSPEQASSIKGAMPKKQLINKLVLGKATFISIEADSSKRIEISPAILNSSNTGTLLAETHIDPHQLIIQLLTSNFQLVESFTNQSHVKFENLKPGNYILRLIIDKNTNGKWDPGNPLIKEEPEPIIIYKNEKNVHEISVKANWEIGPLLITYP